MYKFDFQSKNTIIYTTDGETNVQIREIMKLTGIAWKQKI